jgi:H+/Cl- antiporter ClcA
MTTPADPFAVMRTKKYLVLLILATVLGVVISFLIYWLLKLIAEIQTWVFTDLPKGLGFHGEPPWWPLLPLVVAGVIVGATIKYLPGRGGHSPADGFKPAGVAQANELPGILLAALASIGLGAVVGPEAPAIALGGGLAGLAVKLARRNVEPSAGAVIAPPPTRRGRREPDLPRPERVDRIRDILPGGTEPPPGSAPGPRAVRLGDRHRSRRRGRRLRDPMAGPVPAPARGTAAPAAHHVAGLIIAGLAIAFGEATGKPSSAVLFSGQTALPPLLENAASYTAGTLVLLVVCKGLAYSLSLSSFRGGPTFPGMFIGAAGGIALSHLAGLPMVAGAAMGIGAMTAAMLQLPLTAVLITTLFLGTDGIKVMPLVIVAVVVAFVVTKWLTGPSTAPQVPEPAEAAVPRKSAKPVLTCAQSRRGLPPSRHSRSAFSASSARSRSDPASSFPTDARRDVLTGEWACISTTAAVCSTIVSNTGT